MLDKKDSAGRGVIYLFPIKQAAFLHFSVSIYFEAIYQT